MNLVTMGLLREKKCDCNQAIFSTPALRDTSTNAGIVGRVSFAVSILERWAVSAGVSFFRVFRGSV